jgi:hypothetical protein
MADESDEWWTTSDVAGFLGLQVGTVSSYRQRGQMPAPDKTLGRTHVPVEIRYLYRHPDSRQITGRKERPQSRAISAPGDLATGQTVQKHADNPSGTGPHRRCQVGLDTAGQEEPSRTGIVVDGTLDRTQDLRDLLPLIDEHRLGHPAQRGVRIGRHDGRHSRVVQPQDVRGQPTRRRRLPSRPITITLGTAPNSSASSGSADHCVEPE